MHTKMSIGKRIRAERMKQGLNQTQLAERLGIGSPHLSKIESDGVLPSLELAEAIASALQLNDLVSQVEAARLESYRQQIVSRRGAGHTRKPRSDRQSEMGQQAQAIVDDLKADAALGQAYQQLKTALNNPHTRQAMLSTLGVFSSAPRQAPAFRLVARAYDAAGLRRHFIDNPIPLFLAEVNVTIEPNENDIILHFQNSQFDLEGMTVVIYKVGAAASSGIEKTVQDNDVMFGLNELGLTVRQLDWVRFRIVLSEGRAVEGRLL